MIGSNQGSQKRKNSRRRQAVTIGVDLVMGIVLGYLAFSKSDLVPELIVWIGLFMAGVLIVSAAFRLYLFVALRRFQQKILDATSSQAGAEGLDRRTSPKQWMDI